MPDVQQWGRVWTRHNCRVRRGAWYPLLRLTPEAAVIEVNHESVMVPREYVQVLPVRRQLWSVAPLPGGLGRAREAARAEEHTSELQSRFDLVCRPLVA